MSMWLVPLLAYGAVVLAISAGYALVKLVLRTIRQRRKDAELSALMDRLLGPPEQLLPTGRHRLCPSTPPHATGRHYLRLARLG